MSETFNVYEAKTHLSSLLERAAKGEEIIIAKAGKPLGKLVPLSAKPAVAKGKSWIAPDAFSPEVDAEIAADFYAGEIFPSEAPSSGRVSGFGENLEPSAFKSGKIYPVADDEVVVTKLGKPIYKIKLSGLPLHPERVPGKGEGRGWIADDFDAPLPDEILKGFYGGTLPDFDSPGKPKKKK